MSTVLPPATPDLRRLALLDLAQRARGGLLVHLVIWLLIGGFSGLAGLAPGLFWIVAGAFLVDMVARWRVEPTLADSSLVDLRLARAKYLALLLANPLIWGLACAVEMARPSGTPAEVWIWFAVTGVAASGGVSMAIDPLVRKCYAALSMLPSMAVIVAQRRVDQGFLIFAVPILLLYVWRASRVVYTDYWSAVHAREQLEQRARELEQMSSTDTLTQVANRLHFDRQLTQEWARARREGTPIALMMIDVDHFKKVNDEFGHAFGDTCLQAVAVALRAALTRPGDLLARYGGEEFVVMLPGTDSAGARVVAERLHAAVAGLALRYATRSVPVACSIGVQVANGPGLGSPAAALKCADEALYQAKRQGRNRVVFADPA